MKFLNDFKNLFAIVGVVSIIFWTCSAESTSDNSSDNSSNTNNPPAMTGGTYQVSYNGSYMVALNTETGLVKTYRLVENGLEYNWEVVYNGFTYNDLLLTH